MVGLQVLPQPFQKHPQQYTGPDNTGHSKHDIIFIHIYIFSIDNQVPDLWILQIFLVVVSRNKSCEEAKVGPDMT